jgi:hypothetical protein
MNKRFRQTAQLIRLAAVDGNGAQDLYDSVVDDGPSMEALVLNAVDADDIAQLTPTEWQWYANWRQSLGGRLDRTLLEYLTDSVTTRFARFQVRALVLRDRDTNASAAAWNGDLSKPPNDIGCEWLRRQADLVRISEVLSSVTERREENNATFERLVRSDDALPWYLQGVAAEQERSRRARSDAAWEVQANRAFTEEALELMTDALQCGTHAAWFLLTQLTSREEEPWSLVKRRLAVYAEEHGLDERWYEQGEAVGA